MDMRPVEGAWEIRSDLINPNELVAFVFDPDFGEVVVEALNIREASLELAHEVDRLNPACREIGAGYLAEMRTLVSHILE